MARVTAGAAGAVEVVQWDVAFMAGRFLDEMPGMSFGHAGTIVEGKEDPATEKIARLQAEIGSLPKRMSGWAGWIDVERHARLKSPTARRLYQICAATASRQVATPWARREDWRKAHCWSARLRPAVLRLVRRCSPRKAAR